MPTTYRQALTEHVRFLPFTALTDTAGRRLPLRELYLERALALGSEDTTVQPTSDASEKRSLADLMREPGARVVLAGELGAGKTVCLYHLALDYASSEPPATDLEHEVEASHPLPLLLHVLTGGTAYLWNELPALAGHTDLVFACPAEVEKFLRDSSDGALETLKHELQSGGCLVLIDGDTVVEPPGSAALRAAIERLVAAYPANRFVVTCRTHMLDALLPLDGFGTYSLPAFDDQEVDAFIARWYPVVTQHKQLAPNALAERIAILQGRLRGDEYLRKLADNPLALASCILVCAEGEPQPPVRAIILRRLLECLLGRHHADDDSANTDVAAFMALDQQIDLLQTVAMAIQAALGSSADQDASLPHTHIESLLGDVLEAQGVERRWAAERVVTHLLATWQRQGLLVQSRPSAYQIPWPPVREYLAARALTMQPAFPTYTQTLHDKPHWRGVFPLATHELAHDSAPAVALALPRLLLNLTPGAAAMRDVLLAAECLLELGEHAEIRSPLHDEVREQLLRVLNNHTVPLAGRIRAGLLLGRLGDPRFAELLPPVAHVASGPYLFGNPEGYEDEGPPQRVDVPAFAIGIYPVTHQEFARFLASTPDYPQPHYWHDGRFNNPSQPIVGVTWEDANAYCRWLTIELRQAGLLSPDLVVRLPLEVEWEKAAAWDPRRRAKRRYPWGDEWSSTRANTAAGRGAWLTLPAGCYPDGVSAYGIHDMIGNVWEWMANEYVSYPGAQAPFHEEGSYALRGLSCASLPTHTRCSYRSRLPASYWRYHLGFRIVLSRPLPAPTDESQVQRQSARAKHKRQRTP
jgi:gamma-glutamyl hercynylcysteine S-oxide synthase